MNPPKNTTVYFANLDSLRAIAAFLVIFYHIGLHLVFPENKFTPYLIQVLSFNGLGGSLGVTFFFTLSGFLITYLMFVELEKKGSFSILNFYMRRILRIWPLYYLSLLIGFIGFPLAKDLFDLSYTHHLNYWLYIFFLTNFEPLLNSNPVPGPLGVQWSVAIEEQFYLVWPLIFSICNRKIFPLVLLAITLFSEIFFSLAHDWKIQYYHTLCNVRYLSSGALLATIAFRFPGVVKYVLDSFSKTVTLIVYTSGLLLIFFTPNIVHTMPAYSYLNHMITIAFFLFVIAEQTFSVNKLFSLGSSVIFTRMGKISYGLYLIHMIVITTTTSIFSNNSQWIFLQVVFVLLVTVLLSELSYRFFESPFLKRKDQFSYILTHK